MIDLSDMSLTRRDLVKRQLEINVELGRLAGEQNGLQRQLLDVERRSAELQLELAEIAVVELEFPPPLPQRVKHAG